MELQSILYIVEVIKLKKKAISMFLCMSLILSGCSFEKQSSSRETPSTPSTQAEVSGSAVSAEVSGAAVTAEVSGAAVTANPNSLVVSNSSIVETNKSIKNSSLITLNKKSVGILTINKVERLGIWDWYNKDANAANVKFSYAFNIGIDLTDYLSKHSDAKIVPDIYLVDENDQVIGNTCNVGWSGFNQYADLFNDAPKAVFEIGVQPIKRKLGKYRVKICLTDETNNCEFDPIYYDSSICKKASKGPKLLNEDDIINISSINGGKYRVRFKDICKTSHSLISDNNVKYDFYDMTWIMNYIKKPTNKKSVGIFDSNNKNKLSPSIQFYVTADTDPTQLTYSETSATQERQDEYGSADFQLYCTSTKERLGVGDSFAYRTNRQIPSSTTVKASYIRIHMLFDDEAKARTKKERLKFNGRYVVIQVPIKEVDEINE